MRIVYSTTIEKVGKCAEDFFIENMFITFYENVPSELAEYCFIHSENNLSEEIEPKDILYIGDEPYEIKAVGSVVNENLKLLGHITFNFKGINKAQVPGTLYLEQKKIAPIAVGTTLKIVRV
ncbi:MAG: PTS glucitol/sorbitol transporter subunit IIA [Clostridium butyricum]|nr:PTS glucitol/sorbitol transporter subunit IIA [Clostridium butyricum]MDI9209508.1 PTS glucitol/sorbitol transporter subunit IIA [Clostridium butyricum]MDU4751037.1 PTS glucitol/sorbitol transporter subunit IIA [Clostridium butyricum]MDU4854033.1 PTS glucitol/sorbitol transporter subunit IIA [Clostridioides difficile]